MTGRLALTIQAAIAVLLLVLVVGLVIKPTEVCEYAEYGTPSVHEVCHWEAGGD